MAVRILMLVAVLMALYGCGMSPETKDSYGGVEPLGSEASVFGTVVLTGQDVELEVNVVERAARPGLLLASVYLECGYDMGSCEDPYPWYEKGDSNLLIETLKLVGVAVLSLLVGAAVLLTASYLIAWLLAKRPQATREPNSLNRLGTFLRADWLRTAWLGLGAFFFVMVVVPGALLIYHYSGIGNQQGVGPETVICNKEFHSQAGECIAPRDGNVSVVCEAESRADVTWGTPCRDPS
jgi:hypothetical protein